jgi:hypothetical protein
MASVDDDVYPVQTVFEKPLIRLEHQRRRHDKASGRQHAVLGDDGVAFDTAAATFIH